MGRGKGGKILTKEKENREKRRMKMRKGIKDKERKMMMVVRGRKQTKETA